MPNMLFDQDRRRFTLGLAATAGLAVANPAPAVARSPQRRWSEAGLDALRREARALGVLGMVVRTDGETVLSDGDVSRPLRIASIRKSFLSALYGMIPPDRAHLDASLAELGVDDYTPLTPGERQATVRNLLQARSGIYIPSSAETPAMKAARPARGSYAPGSYWYYNNWDFNVLGEIYQRLTGEGVFAAVEHRLARPLGFRDFDPMQHMRWGYDPEAPRFAAYNMWMSARDLARFGQLFLDRGQWKGQRLVPEAWVAESTRAYSLTGRQGLMSGYGYMWWVTAEQGGADPAGLPPGSFTAAGNGGRYITVLPDQRTVFAVQPDEKQGQPPVPLYARQGAYDGLVRILLAAYRNG